MNVSDVSPGCSIKSAMLRTEISIIQILYNSAHRISLRRIQGYNHNYYNTIYTASALKHAPPQQAAHRSQPTQWKCCATPLLTELLSTSIYITVPWHIFIRLFPSYSEKGLCQLGWKRPFGLCCTNSYSKRNSL